jgi:hypothetical protein
MLGDSRRVRYYGSALPRADAETERSQAPWIAAWGIAGVVLLLVQALYRLTPRALEPLRDGTLEGMTLVLYVGFFIFSLYAEGYRGFQKAFVPRTVARAFHLSQNPSPLRVALAPAYAMALVHAKPKRLVVSWTIFVTVTLCVVFVRYLPPIYRSIIDAGVVGGLGWGLASLLYTSARAFRGEIPDVSIDLPQPSA